GDQVRRTGQVRWHRRQGGNVPTRRPEVLPEREVDDGRHRRRIQTPGLQLARGCRVHIGSQVRRYRPSGVSTPTRWPRHRSSGRGRSPRQWPPRVSVRAYAAAVTAVATVSRLASSQAPVPVAPAYPAASVTACAVSASAGPVRDTPAPLVIACCSTPRPGSGSAGTPPAAPRPVASRGAWPSIVTSGRRSGSSRAMWWAILRANTSASSSELDASRLAPWTPVHATSPHA